MSDKPMDTIGDYYDRCDKRRREALAKWVEARQKYLDDPNHANEQAMWELHEAVIDAGNTGD